MKRLFAIALVLLLPSADLADGPGRIVGVTPSSLFNAETPVGSSTVIPDDAGTIFHFVVKSGVAKNLYGTLAEVGSVPRVASASLGFPNGKSAECAGPFTSAKYFTLPAALLNFTTPLWVTVVGKTGSSGLANELVLSAHSGRVINTNDAAGSDIPFSWSGTISQAFTIYNGINSASVVATPNLNANSVFVFSGAEDGNTTYAKSNQAAVVTQNGSITRAAFAGTPSMGYGPALASQFGTNAPFSGTICEMRITTTTPTSAAITALHSAIVN